MRSTPRRVVNNLYCSIIILSETVLKIPVKGSLFKVKTESRYNEI